MFKLLLLSLPLMAVSYSLGGVSFSLLCGSAGCLLLTCLAVGAVALECSAHEATTFQALIRCWIICAVSTMCCSILPFPFWSLTQIIFAAGSYNVMFLFPAIFVAGSFLLPTLFFLIRAKQVLEARAFVARRNPFGYQFKQFDQYWQ